LDFGFREHGLEQFLILDFGLGPLLTAFYQVMEKAVGSGQQAVRL
jgi:hypothetical protein